MYIYKKRNVYSVCYLATQNWKFTCTKDRGDQVLARVGIVYSVGPQQTTHHLTMHLMLIPATQPLVLKSVHIRPVHTFIEP